VPCRVELTPAAQRDLRSLDRPVLRRIDARIRSLAEEPRPPGAEKLAGESEVYRVRVGDYRILYQIHDAVLTVLVVRVRHRREVYRGF
jgi:mRNA interferase RelE/StbE